MMNQSSNHAFVLFFTKEQNFTFSALVPTEFLLINNQFLMKTEGHIFATSVIGCIYLNFKPRIYFSKIQHFVVICYFLEI